MAEFYHSVTLNEEKCVGCTNCIKRCPTEAIRVRGGKAVIASERCIDCGECIRICPHHAKRARHSHLSQLSDFTYTIALPAPSLYGQFNNLDDIDYVLTGLKEMGFDDVFEVSRAAELVSEATRQYISEHEGQIPLISTACPSVVRLIRVRFPTLIPHLLPQFLTGLILLFPHAILHEASVTFLGFGLPTQQLAYGIVIVFTMTLLGYIERKRFRV